MKKFIFLAMVSFLLALFASCSQTNGSGDVSLTAKVPQAFFSETSVESMELEIALSGDYKDSKTETVTEKNNEKTFEFAEIPVGSEIKITASLKEDGKTVKSGSENVVIKRGENSVKIKLSSTESADSSGEATEDDSIYIILWNRLSEEYKTQGTIEQSGLTVGFDFFNLDSITTNQKVESSKSSINSNKALMFCIDENQNFYVYGTEGFFKYSFNKSQKQWEGYDIGLNVALESGEYGTENILGMRCYKSYMYFLYKDAVTDYKILKIDSSNTISEIPLSNDDGKSFNLFEISDDSIFLYSSGKITKFNMNGTNGIDIDIVIDVYNVTDLHYQNGCLYGLFVNYSSTKGGIFKINTADMSLGTWKSGEPLLGFAKDAAMEDDNTTTNLFRPTRFIGIAPKKLIISDDGVYYSFEQPQTSKNHNRVVEIDLETETVSKVTPVGVMFDAQSKSTACCITVDSGN